ncbi:MAG: DUF2852 domain-containing protein [Alphaproteobacteria bacterium]|nr:DUF2852 domain-containing protein [Alphaproteobacteria bacterium]
MELAAKLDDYGKPAWIAVMVVGFILFWPIGLAILAYLIWSGRMGCGKHRGPGRWHYSEGSGRRSGWKAHRKSRHSSGNSAFDEYREDMLRRLEEEQSEFRDYLERLRHAKDKAEFDQFMEDRKRRRDEPEAPESPEPNNGGNGGPAPQPAG